MYSLEIVDTKGVRQHEVVQFPCVLGKGSECDVQLSGWRVARKHAELHKVDNALRLIDCGSLNGTWVNGERIVEFGPLIESDEINIGGIKVSLRSLAKAELARSHVADRDAPVHQASRTEAAYLALFPLRRSIHKKLLQAIDLKRLDVRQLSAPQLRKEVRVSIELLLKDEAVPIGFDSEQFISDSLDEILGLGLLEPLLADEQISEIMVNSSQEVFVERNGSLSRCPQAFTSEDALRQIIERIVAPLGRRIDESSPMVDARLADGSRVNAIIPPLALRGPALTIRKFNRKPMTPEQLLSLESLSAPMLNFLKLCVNQRLNMLISGGTGSGKTTLLNALSNLIPEQERIITIEDAAELRLHHEHWVSLESRPSNLEGKGAITIRDLVKNTLRMRPDRIVVGECRGGEALDMLQAMNTGHDGSLTTLHANNPRDAIARLEVLVLMAGMDLPLTAVREQIASAVDIVIQQSRSIDGKRRITSIVEVSGMESGRVQLQEIFTWRNQEFQACGIVPSFFQEMQSRGEQLDYSTFAQAGQL